MASLDVIQRSVDKLTAAYGRNPSESSYEAFAECLADIKDNEVDVATTRLLRGGGQFLPSAAEMRRAALDFRGERHEIEKLDEDQTRKRCALCEGRGYLLTFNRHWLDQHVDEFCDSWFVAGWFREADLWCKQNRYETLLVNVICDCGCRNSKIWLAQIERWKNRDPGEKKISYPSFFGTFKRDYDCVVPCPIEDRDGYLRLLLLKWKSRT